MTAAEVRGHLNINEVFDTAQGEGPFCGHPATFVRMAGCNLACSWCDTTYSWDWTRHDRAAESHKTPVAALVEQLGGQTRTGLVVLTGGEPLLQAPMLANLVAYMPRAHFQVETNGTVPPGLLGTYDNVSYVVSPKLANGGDSLALRHKEGLLHAYASACRGGVAWFKFVVCTQADIEVVAQLAAMYDLPRDRVYCMPEGATADAHLASLQLLADRIVARGFNIAVRMHLLAWPTQTRGR